MVGYSLRTRDHIRSAAAWTRLMGCRVIITCGGASGEVMARRPEEPMCRFITVPQSVSARHTGSQYSEWKLG
jgi:hypothetical protein